MLSGLLVLVAVLALVRPWGPGHHLEFAQRVYRNRNRTFPKRLANLLRRERDAFLYGNIAADIINFKGFGGHQNHCHRWTIIEEMRARATTDAEHAFCYGYLAHLAADTIAHNHFVPYHLVRYARSKGLGHLYWEMRADQFIPDSRWDAVSRLKRLPDLDRLDDLVNEAVPKKALSMRANKIVFNHVLLVAERDRWRRGVQRLHGMASAPLEKAFLERFRRAAVARIRLAFSDAGLASLAHIDTTGRAAQRAAWRTRKRILRRLASSERRRAEAEQAAARYLEGMESPPPGGGAPHW